MKPKAMPLSLKSPFGAKELFEQVEIFSLKDASAFIISANHGRSEKPWVWIAPALADTSLEVFAWYIKNLTQAGISVAGYDIGEVRGSPQSSARFHEFYQAMIAKAYASRPILLAKSRGALMLLAWAFRHPQHVAAFAGIYPVCNLLSWPLRNKPNPVLEDYAMSRDQLLQVVEKVNPIHQLKPLADAQVPIFLVHGTDDDLVPLSENSELVVENYQSLGGTVQLDRLPGMGHDETVDFLENQRVLHFLLQSKCDFVESPEID